MNGCSAARALYPRPAPCKLVHQGEALTVRVNLAPAGRCLVDACVRFADGVQGDEPLSVAQERIAQRLVASAKQPPPTRRRARPEKAQLRALECRLEAAHVSEPTLGQNLLSEYEQRAVGSFLGSVIVVIDMTKLPTTAHKIFPKSARRAPHDCLVLVKNTPFHVDFLETSCGRLLGLPASELAAFLASNGILASTTGPGPLGCLGAPPLPTLHQDHKRFRDAPPRVTNAIAYPEQGQVVGIDECQHGPLPCPPSLLLRHAKKIRTWHQHLCTNYAAGNNEAVQLQHQILEMRHGERRDRANVVLSKVVQCDPHGSTAWRQYPPVLKGKMLPCSTNFPWKAPPRCTSCRMPSPS